MTAYLQPGDKIVLCAPGHAEGAVHDQEIIDFLTRIYAEIGVTVVFVAIGAPGIPLSVVSVLREPRAAVPTPMAGKLKPVETLPPLQARWPVPWQDALDPQPHPGYQDHPRVP